MKKPPFTQPIFSNTEPEPVVSKKAKEGLWQSGDGIRLSPIQKQQAILDPALMSCRQGLCLGLILLQV